MPKSGDKDITKEDKENKEREKEVAAARQEYIAMARYELENIRTGVESGHTGELYFCYFTAILAAGNIKLKDLDDNKTDQELIEELDQLKFKAARVDAIKYLERARAGDKYFDVYIELMVLCMKRNNIAPSDVGLSEEEFRRLTEGSKDTQ